MLFNRRLPRIPKWARLVLAALSIAATADAQDALATRTTPSSPAATSTTPATQPDTDRAADTTATDTTVSRAEERARSRARRSFRTHLALGFVTSVLAHESGHIIAALAVGGHPSFGFNKFRPTIYSGIDASLHPTKQFIFSSAGLTVQSLLDEAILDAPHGGGSAFERGLLAGGIGTSLFYITLGRNGAVSDVAYMAQTSKLSKDQVSLIYGGIAVLHAVRIHFKPKYAHFFTAPSDLGGVKVGMRIDGDWGQ